MVPTDHSSGYSSVSRILLKNNVREGNIIGATDLNISLQIESWPLVLSFSNCSIPLKISCSMKGEYNTGLSSSITCIVKKFSSGFSAFSESKSLEKCSIQLFGQISFRVSRLTFPFSDFKCIQKRLDYLVMFPIS